MKKIIFSLLLLISLFLVSCNKATANYEYSFIDDSNEAVYVNYNPKNTAILYASLSDIWLNSGGSIKIGVKDVVNRGFASDIEVVGDNAGKNIALEDLVAKNPDFVVMQKDFADSNNIASKLRDYKIPVALFNIDTFDDYLNVLDKFCKINKANEEVYKKYGLNIKDKIDDVIDLSKDKKSENVLLLRATTTSKMTSLSNTNFVGSMLADLKAINIASINSAILNELSMEAILSYNPTKIFVVPMGDEEKAFEYAKSRLASDVWQNIDAIKNEKVFYLEKDLFHYKPNEKWGIAYEKLYQCLYE